MQNLKLESFSDREILHLIDDLADGEGWVTADTLAQKINLAKGDLSDADYTKYARRCVGVRLSWIRRLSQTVEKAPGRKDEEGSRWRLTVAGQAVVKAKLTAEVAGKLANIGEFSTLSAISLLGKRYMKAGPASANLMRREWAHGTHSLRRGS